MMKVKMTDIARKLNVSKATVSLALNDRPGVSVETKKKVQECYRELMKEKADFEKEEKTKSKKNMLEKIIKIVFINHNKQIIVNPEMDLWSVVLKSFDIEARKRDALCSMLYLDGNLEQEEMVISECNMDKVLGVIIFGTEMEESDYGILEKINKPIVVYDCEMTEGNYCSVCIDNKNAVDQAMDSFRNAGVRDIRYLSTGKDIYNFEKRRKAFFEKISPEDMTEDTYIVLGGTVNEIAENARLWLEQNSLPEAFLFENYQISIGVMLALRKKKISAPKDIKLIGIDEVPEYMLSGSDLTCLKIPYRARAIMCMKLLDMLAEQDVDVKMKVYAKPKMIWNGSI